VTVAVQSKWPPVIWRGKGPRGPRGARGFRGAQGAIGPKGVTGATVGDTTWGYACWDNGTTLTSDWEEAASSASLTYDFYEFNVETTGTTATNDGAVGTDSVASPIFATDLGNGAVAGAKDTLGNEGATGTTANTKVGLDPMVQLTYHVTPAVIDSAQLRASLSAGKTAGTSTCTLSGTFYTTQSG
jgi:hypothetical protein